MEILKPLTKANVLAKVNQFDIFKCYCTPFNKLYKPFKSELRVDKRPTCSICKVGDKLIYRDFGTNERTLDCFSYIQSKYSVSFKQALEMINQDFNLRLMSFGEINVPRSVKAETTDFNIKDIPEYVIDIRVVIRDWTEKDKEYWNGKYDLTRATLEKYQVYPLQGYFINNLYTGCGGHVYGYYFGKSEDGRELWKIYQPYATKEIKWRSNCQDDILQGWKQLPETGDFVIITKSLKDVMVLNQLGFNAVAPQAESNNLQPQIVEELKSRFENVILLYDNDTAGIKAAEKIAEEHDLSAYTLPEGTKDASDFVELYGGDTLVELINEVYGTYSNNSPMGS